MIEIQAGIRGERMARNGLVIRQAFFGRVNFFRFLIAFILFFLHQWSGQPSVASYSPQIFSLVSYEELSSIFWDIWHLQSDIYNDRYFILC